MFFTDSSGTRGYLFGAAVMFLLSTSGGALADGNLNCDAYAQVSVKDAQTNALLGCGFSGEEWSTRYGDHLTWCQQEQVKMANLTAVDNGRKQALAQCERQGNPDGGSKAAECNRYAEEAMAAQTTNQRRDCGYSGARFGSTLQGHFNWCMGAGYNQIIAETNARRESIKICETKANARGACRFFALAIQPLYDEQNKACAGRDDFFITFNSYDQDTALCLQDGLEASQARIPAMQERIAECKQNQ